MIRILVVEDDAEKLRQVLLCIQSVEGIEASSIVNARDAITAKGLLRKDQFDLLVLDISLPNRSDETATPNGGLSLLQELMARDVYQVPHNIVGLTAYDDAFIEAKPIFETDLLQIILYDPASNEWFDKLSRLTRRLKLTAMSSSSPVTFANQLCIITALATPELDAVLDLPWNWAVKEISNDPTIYHAGSYVRSGTRHEVIAASAPRMGMQASAVLASKMIMTFRPRYLAMVGVLAGIKGECELGDIIAADPSWDYESGKKHGAKDARIFSSAPHQISLDPFVRNKLVQMSRDKGMIDEIRRSWPGTNTNTLLSMTVAPVASGAAVLEDLKVVAEIKKQHRKALGIEMETYGVYVAAEEMPAPQPKAFSIKSVCDFADPHKNNNHQKYASFTSAVALRYFVERYL